METFVCLASFKELLTTLQQLPMLEGSGVVATSARCTSCSPQTLGTAETTSYHSFFQQQKM